MRGKKATPRKKDRKRKNKRATCHWISVGSILQLSVHWHCPSNFARVVIRRGIAESKSTWSVFFWFMVDVSPDGGTDGEFMALKTEVKLVSLQQADRLRRTLSNRDQCPERRIYRLVKFFLHKGTSGNLFYRDMWRRWMEEREREANTPGKSSRQSWSVLDTRHGSRLQSFLQIVLGNVPHDYQRYNQF